MLGCAEQIRKLCALWALFVLSGEKTCDLFA